jgi:hypothetical protein
VTSSPNDPFSLLGLRPGCAIEEVYAARRQLARRWHPDLGGESQQMAEINDAVVRCVAILKGRVPQQAPAPAPADEGFVDHPSFRIEALPAQAHEALRIVCSWLGEVVVDDPPYLLECVLSDPGPCWCQFHLLPEAGSSMVGLRVMGIENTTPPTVRRVRDEVISALNQLDWDEI